MDGIEIARLLLYLHLPYLVHVALTECFYSGRLKAFMVLCRIRTNFASLQPLLLESVHNFETMTVSALFWFYVDKNRWLSGTHCVLASFWAFALLAIYLIPVRSIYLVTRSNRLSDATAAISLALCTFQYSKLIATVLHLHALVIPERTPFRLLLRQHSRRPALLLVSIHAIAALFAFHAAQSKSIPRKACLASLAAFLIFLARDLAHALERAWPRPQTQYYGPAANYRTAATDIRPTPLFFRTLAFLEDKEDTLGEEHRASKDELYSGSNDDVLTSSSSFLLFPPSSPLPVVVHPKPGE